jgi:hypothetical protein
MTTAIAAPVETKVAQTPHLVSVLSSTVILMVRGPGASWYITAVRVPTGGCSVMLSAGYGDVTVTDQLHSELTAR